MKDRVDCVGFWAVKPIIRLMSYRPNPRYPLETLLIALSGWLPVLAGMGLLGMALITPAWLGWRELLWQRDMVRLQAERLAEQRASYAEFHEALVADDPVLLERLAFTHLRYKPRGKRLLEGTGDSSVTAVMGSTGGVPGEYPGVIGHWLASPQPAVGRDIAAFRPINTRLTRLASGLSRFVLIAVGLICLLAGLWPEREGGAERQPVPVREFVRFEATTRRGAWGLSRWGRRLFPTSRSRP